MTRKTSILLSAVVLALSSPFMNVDAAAMTAIHVPVKKNVQVLFTRQMTSADLKAIAERMRSKGIKVTYDKQEFDKSGHLTSLDITVDCGDGFKGSAGATLKGQKFGFIRSYNNKKTPFQIGNL